MLDLELVRKTEDFVRRKFESGVYLTEHPEAGAYRLEHTYRVANIGRLIAEKEGFDETEMVIACLLHDVSYCEDFGEDGWKEHGRRAAQIARPFLTGLGLPEARVNDICYGIAIHVDDEADFAGERTAFALSVGDADNIDRFDAYRIHEILCEEGFIAKSFDEKQEFVRGCLERLEKCKELPMATRTAQELWQERIGFYIEFYRKLEARLSSSVAVME